MTDATPRRASFHAETPLVTSRSLGALLGFGALAFKLETCQPTGSWLDRDAALLVQQAVADGLTGLCVVVDGPPALPLAIQCARAGLRMVVLTPSFRTDEPTGHAEHPTRLPAADGWLAALGARQVRVDAGRAEVEAAARQIAEGAGLLLVETSAGSPSAGLEAVAAEIAEAGFGASLLAAPALTNGGEAAHLFTPVLGVLTRLDLEVSVTAREVDAARVLLAREEGLIASATGAAALATLVRTVRDDRARRPRERRFARDLSAVVVLTGEPLGVGGNPPAAMDAVPSRAVTPADLVADPRRLLVEPPGHRQA